MKFSKSQDFIDFLLEDVIPTQSPMPQQTGTAAPVMQPQQQTVDQPEITAEQIIDTLNQIRGGRSTKDEQVKQEFDKWFGQFTKEQKFQLYTFLSGISQVLTIPEQPAGQVPENEVALGKAQQKSTVPKQQKLPIQVGG